MKNLFHNGQFKQMLIDIRSSLWFVPALMTLGAMALAVGLLEIDRHYGDALREWWPRLFETEPEGASNMLSAIAGAMATVAGVVFSITIVALALTSSQYTSRALRNFMRDRSTQVVLGVFVGLYIYCLLVLRTVSGGEWAFQPAASVLGAVILAIVAIGFFIYFIHHISSSIQASEIAASITRETIDSIERLFPNEIGEDPDETAIADIPANLEWFAVAASGMGYIQGVDPEALLEYAQKHRTVLRMERGVGEFVTPGRPLASLALSKPPDQSVIDGLNEIYAIGSYRTIGQDAAFGIRQLVDISLKALSPGINDTTTAVTCIEHLSYLLVRCAERAMPAPCRYDKDGLRVIAKGPSFEYLLNLSFNQILENAEANTEILIRVLIAIEQIAQVTQSGQRKRLLERQIREIEEIARRSVKSGFAMQRIEEEINRTRLAL